MPENEEVLPEVVVKKANTKDGNVGWDIRLQRQQAFSVPGVGDLPGETDAEYFARIVEMYERCEKRWGKKEPEKKETPIAS